MLENERPSPLLWKQAFSGFSMDEREARQVAQQLGLQVMGTLGILLLAKRNQTILNLDDQL
jgi:predicted nucleic acid-binding protein